MVDEIPGNLAEESQVLWTRMHRIYAHVIGLPGPACFARGALLRHVDRAEYGDPFRTLWTYRMLDSAVGLQDRYRASTMDLEHFLYFVQHLLRLAEDEHPQRLAEDEVKEQACATGT